MRNGFRRYVHTLETKNDIMPYQNSMIPKQYQLMLILPVSKLTCGFILYSLLEMQCQVIIIARPKKVVKQLFESLDTNAFHVEKALSSMEHDSQRDSIVRRDLLASSKYISTTDRTKIDSILSSKFNLPLQSDFRK